MTTNGIPLEGCTKLAPLVDEWIAKRNTHGATVSVRGVVPQDLELLRNHRNRFEVRRWLEYDAEISAESQIQWYQSQKHSSVHIVEDSVLGCLGLARVGPAEACVGADAFVIGRGDGKIVFEIACRLAYQRWRQSLHLWVFQENSRAVSVYKKAGFSFDTQSDVRWMLREFDGVVRPTPYVRMHFLINK